MFTALANPHRIKAGHRRRYRCALSSRSYPDGANASYRRDANDQISAIDLSPPRRGASPAVSNVSYLSFGPISRYTLGNGQTITRSYDANQRLADLTSPALNLHYARYPMGNITAQGDASDGANPTETYSHAFRTLPIVSASPSTLWEVERPVLLGQTRIGIM